MSDDPTITDFLADMLDSTRKARRFVEGFGYEEFIRDERTAFAVVRALEIIGEAAKQIPENFRTGHADVPWRTICGMRDKLIHAYGTVNYAVVWNTVAEDLPKLELQLERILSKV